MANFNFVCRLIVVNFDFLALSKLLSTFLTLSQLISTFLALSNLNFTNHCHIYACLDRKVYALDFLLRSNIDNARPSVSNFF